MIKTITRRQLRQIIKETLAHAVFDDVHVVPDDLESLDPHDAYGLGHEAGMEHEDEEEVDDGCGDTVEFADDIDNEGPSTSQMPASWRQILGNTLAQED